MKLLRKELFHTSKFYRKFRLAILSDAKCFPKILDTVPWESFATWALLAVIERMEFSYACSFQSNQVKPR